MKYMLLIYGAESCWTEAERQACMRESSKVCQQLEAAGKYIAASPLQLVETAKTVRLRGDQRQVITGPFAETVEQLGGFYILELDDLDEAIAVAGRLPPALKGTVEIRPVMAVDDLPADRFDLIERHESHLTPYMLLCYDDESAWREGDSAALQAAIQEAVALCRELDRRDRYISAAPLHSSETATSLRIRNGKQLLTDGPFAETREVLGGYYLVLAGNQAEALHLAARHPGARFGAVEIRPLYDLLQLEPVFSPELSSSKGTNDHA